MNSNKGKIVGITFASCSGLFAAAPVAPLSPQVTAPGSVPVRPEENSNRLPTDIYSEYFEARRMWSQQKLASADLQSFAVATKKGVAMELKVSEGIINSDGPAVSDDGRICVNYTVDRSNLPATNLSDISPRMERLAKSISDRNASPVPDSYLTASHFKTLDTDTSGVVPLLFACLAPNTL